jgi:hypothetical protein
VAEREVRERLVFEIADDELDLGVLAVLGVDVVHRLGAVANEREVPPVGKQLSLVLLGVQMDAAHDQAIGPSVVSASSQTPVWG